MVELIVVIAIIGLTLSIAVAYFHRFATRARLESAARTVQMSLLKARIEAIRRGNDIGVEVSTNSVSTAYRTAVVYVDANSNGAYDTGETVLVSNPLPPSDSALTFRIDTYGAPTPSSASTTFDFIFTPFGSATTAGATKAVFVSDPSNNLIQVGIPIAASGKVAMTKKDSSGNYVAPPWSWNS